MTRRFGRSAAFSAGAMAALALVVWLALARREAEEVESTARVAAPRLEPPVAAAPRELPAPAAPDRAGQPGPVAADIGEAYEDTSLDETHELTEDTDGMSADLQSMPDQDAIAAAWATVDLEEVRRAMPDNLYFQMSAPTTDEAVIAERAAERSRWNDEYGKVLSGTGTEEEVLAYFDLRARLSSDYLEFVTYLLDNHGQSLDERDVGLLDLARRLHAARLQEIPRQVEEALARKRQQDAARAAWLADEEAFADTDPGAD
jgi:hypothetical protein